MDIDRGVFVEAGANDGISQSNTLYFERYRSWRGLLIEPIPALARQCRSLRPRSVTVNAAIGSFAQRGTQLDMSYCNLMSVVDGAMKSPEEERLHVKVGAEVQSVTPYRLRVRCVPLSDLLDLYGIGRIDLLSLDVEGYEANALRGIDFTRHRPRYLLIEARYREDVEEIIRPFYRVVEEFNERDILYAPHSEIERSYKFGWTYRLSAAINRLRWPLQRQGNIKPMIFCTLFNRAYLPNGLALYQSLRRTLGDNMKLYILGMDEFTVTAIRAMQLANVSVVTLDEIEDDALRAVKPARTVGEYCWTCTTPLLMHVQDRHPAGTVVTYVDADIRFFSDPTAILTELGDASIFIHEHDFAPEFAHLLRAAGRFNVGVVSFRNDSEGRTCLERWRAQCIQECVMDPAAGKCGDQNYLDEWPQIYSNLVVSKNPGVGLGPWNIGKHVIQKNRKGAMVDGDPVVFYHYHSLRLLRPRFGLKPTLMAGGSYLLDPSVVRIIYRPYVRELLRNVTGLSSIGFPVHRKLTSLPDVYPRAINHQFLFSAGGFALPANYTPQLIESLYGIDGDREKFD